MKLVGRHARRNYLYLFAWLCAVVLPVVLQVVAGAQDETRDYLGFYYGGISLYLFFVLTYGFGTVFVSFYAISTLRKAGTLDVLRISRVQPWEVVTGVFLVLQRVLLPPLLVFLPGFLVYTRWFVPDGFLAGESLWLLLGMALVIVLNEIILAGIVCLGLFRDEAPWALISVVVMLVLIIMPIFLLWILRWPVWAFATLMLGITGLIWSAAILRVGALWRAQVQPLRE